MSKIIRIFHNLEFYERKAMEIKLNQYFKNQI